MNTTDRQLLSLLRTSLWGVPANTSLLSEGVDWSALLSLADKQTIVGWVYDSVLSLPTSMMPPPVHILRQAHLQTIRIAQSHQLLNTTLAEISNRLKAEGICSVLLKGQGVARNYPNPLRRACGDIDLYVGEPQYERTCCLLHQWGITDETATESVQHLHFSYNGVCVELHRIAGIMYNDRNRLFRQWSDDLLQGSTCRTAVIGNAEIQLPPVRFDVFFIFYHTYRHFLNGGVGLRQLCDWAMYLHSLHKEIDRSRLQQDLQRFRLMHPWQVMGHIAVRHLGLPPEEFPFFSTDANVCKTGDSMIKLILQSGNFGFHDPQRTKRPDGYIAGKAHNFLLVHRRLWQVFPLCPADTLCYYTTFLTAGIAQLFKDKFTKQTITGTIKR